MAILVVDTNVFSLLIKLKGGHLKKDKLRAERYLAFLQGQELARAFPTEGELLLWLENTDEGARKRVYEKGVREILDQTGLVDGTPAVARQWARIMAAGETGGRLHIRDSEHPNREAQLNDTWIAACALAHGLALVSDDRGFEWMVAPLGLNLVNFHS